MTFLKNPKTTDVYVQSRVEKIVSVWMFGDVSFAVLPIFTIILLSAAVGHTFSGLLLLKEWSFATIVLFGAAIRRLIKLKVEVQLRPRSHKLETGVQFFVLFVIASVVVLSLVVLQEFRVLRGLRDWFLGVAQLFLFCCSLLSMWLTVWHEENWRNVLASRDVHFQKLAYLRYVRSQVDDCFAATLRARDAFGFIGHTPSNQVDEHSPEERQLIKEIGTALEGVEGLMQDLIRLVEGGITAVVGAKGE